MAVQSRPSGKSAENRAEHLRVEQKAFICFLSEMSLLAVLELTASLRRGF